MATVYKRNSTYWVRFQHHGKEVRQSAHTTSKATAQQFLVQLLEEHHRLDRGGCPRRTCREAIECFTHDYLPTRAGTASMPRLPPGTESQPRDAHKAAAAGSPSVPLSLLADEAEMPASLAAARTPLPDIKYALAFSTFTPASGGRPNLTDALLAAA